MNDVIWIGNSRDLGGYANLSRNFMFGLEDCGANVCHMSIPGPAQVDAKTLKRLQRLEKNMPEGPAKTVWATVAPPRLKPGYNVLLTMMETRHLHPEYVRRCNLAAEVIVPSKWCRDMFAESGVNRPIHVVPLGVDTALYSPDAEPLPLAGIGPEQFVFLSVFNWSLHKGYDALLEAYFREFSGDEHVVLVVATRFFGSTSEEHKKMIRDEIARLKAIHGGKNPPRIAFLGEATCESGMHRLYGSADCFALLSRGEGFGLPYLEAAASGLPIIATNYSGHTDFLDKDNAYLVDIDGFAVASPEMAKSSEFFEGQEFPVLGPRVVKDAMYLMRYVFDASLSSGCDSPYSTGLRLREKILKEYDWKAANEVMYWNLFDGWPLETELNHEERADIR